MLSKNRETNTKLIHYAGPTSIIWHWQQKNESDWKRGLSTSLFCQQLRLYCSTDRFGDWAISVPGLTEWNSLPESVESAETPASW